MQAHSATSPTRPTGSFPAPWLRPGLKPGFKPAVRPGTGSLAALLTAALLTLASPVSAGDDDAARARAALRAGEIAPLTKVLAAVQAEWQGEVIAVELDHEDEGWVYEVKLLGPQGSVIKLDYDARNVTLLKSRGAGVTEARRKP